MEIKIISLLDQVNLKNEEDIEKFMKSTRGWMLGGKNYNWSAERDMEGNLILKRS